MMDAIQCECDAMRWMAVLTTHHHSLTLAHTLTRKQSTHILCLHLVGGALRLGPARGEKPRQSPPTVPPRAMRKCRSDHGHVRAAFEIFQMMCVDSSTRKNPQHWACRADDRTIGIEVGHDSQRAVRVGLWCENRRFSSPRVAGGAHSTQVSNRCDRQRVGGDPRVLLGMPPTVTVTRRTHTHIRIMSSNGSAMRHEREPHGCGQRRVRGPEGRGSANVPHSGAPRVTNFDDV